MSIVINGLQRPVSVPTETVKSIVETSDLAVRAASSREIESAQQSQASPFTDLKVTTPRDLARTTPGSALLGLRSEIIKMINSLREGQHSKEQNDLSATWKTFQQAVKISDRPLEAEVANANKALEAVFTTAEGILSELKRRETPIAFTLKSSLPLVQADITNYIYGTRAQK